MRILPSLLFLSMIAACGGKSAPATTPAQPAAETLPDIPFDSMNHDQKVAFMKQKVMPTMKPIFQDHNPTKFAKFTCKTCHGDGAASGHFDMPNPQLPKLDFKNTSKYDKGDLEWMEKQVKPTMAKLVQMPEYTEQNPKGFGCLACHTPAQGS